MFTEKFGDLMEETGKEKWKITSDIDTRMYEDGYIFSYNEGPVSTEIVFSSSSVQSLMYVGFPRRRVEYVSIINDYNPFEDFDVFKKNLAEKYLQQRFTVRGFQEGEMYKFDQLEVIMDDYVDKMRELIEWTK